MTHDWSKCYQRIESLPPGSGPIEAWLSAAVSDQLWDEFLQSTPCGQFQQSSMWAEYKAGEGWMHHRVILTDADGIIGGFQILWKKTKLIRIGYVSKGPVAHPETTDAVRLLDGLLCSAAKELGLTALIAQSPDEARHAPESSSGSDFVQSNPLGIIESTYLVDVRPEMEVLRGRMSPSLRRNIRKAKKQLMAVLEGTDADIPHFFELMAETCRRQNTKPNPVSITAVRKLWQAFSPNNSIRLTFAECEGTRPAAKLSLIFGDRVTVWKKGWDGSHDHWHTNELLEDDALEWAHQHGHRVCDFCSLNRATTRRLLEGDPLAHENLSSRDEYHLRFGGNPQLLPLARVLIPNPVLRWAYHRTYARYERWRDGLRPSPVGAV